MNKKQLLHSIILFFLICMPISGHALTSKTILAGSSIGEKLTAELPIEGISKNEISKLKVTLASVKTYKRFNISYKKLYSSLSIAIKKRKNNIYYISLTSSKPITQSSLDILIKIKKGLTSSFRLYRVRLMPDIVQETQAAATDQPAEIKRPVAVKKPLAVKKPIVIKKPVEVSKPVAVTKPPSVTNPVDLKNVETKSLSSKTPIQKNGSEKQGNTKELPATELDEYHVELRADKELFLPGDPGELTVWIGNISYKPDADTGKASAKTSIPAIGQTAKVVPQAPTFKVTPEEFICMKVHPTGSTATFAITPLKKGTHEIGATVHMFESDDCSGAPVPKTVKKLSVDVKVATGEIIEGYGLQLWEKFWEGVLEFWGWLIATFFGLLIFLIRKKLKKWFGYEDKE